jgi:hypothetical protein
MGLEMARGGDFAALASRLRRGYRSHATRQYIFLFGDDLRIRTEAPHWLFSDHLWEKRDGVRKKVATKRDVMKVSHLRILPAAVASLAVLAGMSGAAAQAATASPAHAAHVTAQVSAKPKGHLKAPVTGTFKRGTTRGHFDGRFMPKKFTVKHGVLEATGVLRGKLVKANGTKLGTIHRTVTLPVRTPKGNAADAASARCSILNLHLGTLNLNLLGLVVHLNPVHLTITAVPGAGNLLGNLLCRITNLLNGPGHLGQIARLLNRVLSLL